MATWRDNYFAAYGGMGLSKWGASGAAPQSLSDKWGARGSGSVTGSKWGTYDPGYTFQDVVNHYTPQQPEQQTGYFGTNAGPIGTPAGGNWSRVNQWDSYVQQASSATGVPGNVIKAIMMIESQGVLNAQSAGNPYFGLMQIGPASAVPEYMKNPGWMRDSPYNQILAGATELANKYRAVGASSWDQAAAAYFGYGTDMFGTTTNQYRTMFNQYMQQLNVSTSGASAGLGANPAATGGLHNNTFVQEALKYVGVKYVWGAIPGASQNPWNTGWDCSGLTYFMDQKYGNGRLPMGSHYQYDYAVKTGQLFTNLSQLQPGDLVFIDTGWQGGAGANLNRAGHVALYIGNGQILQAANPNTGTVVSPLSGYSNILGGMHMSWSGGAGGGYAGGTGGYQTGPQSPRNAWLDWNFR